MKPSESQRILSKLELLEKQQFQILSALPGSLLAPDETSKKAKDEFEGLIESKLTAAKFKVTERSLRRYRAKFWILTRRFRR
jgi:hypothetical protein